jgi:hypothetical protein
MTNIGYHKAFVLYELIYTYGIDVLPDDVPKILLIKNTRQTNLEIHGYLFWKTYRMILMEKIKNTKRRSLWVTGLENLTQALPGERHLPKLTEIGIRLQVKICAIQEHILEQSNKTENTERAKQVGKNSWRENHAG